MRWLAGTVAETIPETAHAVTIRLDVDGWPGHRPGQHVDVRLTAEDGYQAQRSYSIASVADGERVELTVVRLDDGEVSPYLTTVLDVADEVELRGPIGGYFVWDGSEPGPVLLVGGGSGVVPLMAMLRHHAAIGSAVPMRLLYSARTAADLLYRAELGGFGDKVTITLTREPPASTWTGRRGRVDGALLADVAALGSRTYICGPTPFVEAVADSLVALGHDPSSIRAERFGPSGG